MFSVKEFRSEPSSGDRLTEETREFLESCRSENSAYTLSQGAYNISVSHDAKLLWFRVAKVATRSILSVLKEELTLDVTHAMWVQYPIEMFQDYYKFAFVRDPYERVLSAWRDKVLLNNYFNFEPTEYEAMQDLKVFVGWLESLDFSKRVDPHISLQSSLIKLDDVNYIGRFESIDDDFKEVCRALGLSEKSLPHLNKSSQLNITDVSKSLRKRIETIYTKDYEVFAH